MGFSKKQKAFILFVIIVEIIWIFALIKLGSTYGKAFLIKYNIINFNNEPLPDGTIINYEGRFYKVYYVKEL